MVGIILFDVYLIKGLVSEKTILITSNFLFDGYLIEDK